MSKTSTVSARLVQDPGRSTFSRVLRPVISMSLPDVSSAPNEGSGRHLPPLHPRLINVILLDGRASTAIDTRRGGGGSGGDGGSGGGIVTFANRGTRNEERDETDGGKRKGHRPAPQTDW